MSREDRSVSALVLLATALFGWQAMQGRAAPRPVDLPVPQPAAPFEERVNAIAEAIAVSEGFYAPGGHDGRSLPWRLNNPGALKKPALDAADLPTWKDTGLVVFPSEAMGWAALRHQVRLMLTGESRIYQPTDTLLGVAVKYADGDINWGGNVAARLGIDPDVTLAELAER